MANTDTISIHRLRLTTIIGCNPEEQLFPQTVFATITLECDLEPSGHTDDLSKTVNYATLAEAVTREIQSHSYKLIETIAERIAAICGQEPLALSATVTIEKPSGLPSADFASVTIRRRFTK